MALEDSMRDAMEQRLQWLKQYVGNIRAAVEELPKHDQEIAEIETALADADAGKVVTVPVAKREVTTASIPVEEAKPTTETTSASTATSSTL